MAKIDDFKKELKDLLSKYNAGIDFDCDEGSDTHGISGEGFVINLDGKDHRINYGWGIDKHDLN